MKTELEKQENIEGCKIKLQESIDNEYKFASVLTPETREGYQKTQSYIRGWIDFLEDKPKSIYATKEYEVGYMNANNWLNG